MARNITVYLSFLVLAGHQIKSENYQCSKEIEPYVINRYINPYTAYYDMYDAESYDNITYCQSMVEHRILKGIKNYSNLILNLEHKKIKRIRRGQLSNLTKCMTIDLHENKIREISDTTFEDLINLRVLILSYNKLTQVHKGMWNGLHSLRYLDLRDNAIHIIGKAGFLLLGKLHTLLLESNKLTAINTSSEYWMGLSSLKVLHLGDNRLRYIEKEAWYPLTNLSTINLRDIKLSTLDIRALGMLSELNVGLDQRVSTEQKILFPTSLLTLNIWSGKVTNLTSGIFIHLIHLTWIRIYENEIQNIEAGTFSMQKNLLHLSIQYNRITAITSGMWEGLLQLQELDIHSNRIENLIGKAFEPLQSLTHLILNYNKLSHLNTFSFAGLVNLRAVDLSYNPLLVISSSKQDYRINKGVRRIVISAGKNNISGSTHSAVYCTVYNVSIFRWWEDYKKCNISGLSCQKYQLYHSLCLENVLRALPISNLRKGFATVSNESTVTAKNRLLSKYAILRQQKRHQGLKQKADEDNKKKESDSNYNRIDEQFNVGISFVGPCGIILISGTSFMVWRLRKNYKKKKLTRENELKNAQETGTIDEPCQVSNSEPKAESQQRTPVRFNIPEIIITMPQIIITESQK